MTVLASTFKPTGPVITTYEQLDGRWIADASDIDECSQGYDDYELSAVLDCVEGYAFRYYRSKISNAPVDDISDNVSDEMFDIILEAADKFSRIQPVQFVGHRPGFEQDFQPWDIASLYALVREMRAFDGLEDRLDYSVEDLRLTYDLSELSATILYKLVQEAE